MQIKVSGANLCTGDATTCTTDGDSLGVDEVAEKAGPGAEVETCTVLPKMTQAINAEQVKTQDKP